MHFLRTMRRVRLFFNRNPVTRGMLTYSFLYPGSNLTQQYLANTEPPLKINWTEVFRFWILGSFWVAPTMFSWIKISGTFLPGSTPTDAVKKAYIEQFTYWPMAIATFYGYMTLLQGKEVQEAREEVRLKFWPTYKVGFLFWPVIQSLNYIFIPEKNRVPVISCASFFWVNFLSYMKKEKIEEEFANDIEDGDDYTTNLENTSVVKPLVEKPPDEKPLNEKPLNEKALDEKPLVEKPLEEKPLDEKTLDEKTVDKV